MEHKSVSDFIGQPKVSNRWSYPNTNIWKQIKKLRNNTPKTEDRLDFHWGMPVKDGYSLLHNLGCVLIAETCKQTAPTRKTIMKLWKKDGLAVISEDQSGSFLPDVVLRLTVVIQIFYYLAVVEAPHAYQMGIRYSPIISLPKTE